MIQVIKKYSPQFMILATVLGFIFYDISNVVFRVLPAVLFLLMFVTLIGIDHKKLLKSMVDKGVWIYAFVHSFILSLLVCCGAYFLGADKELLIAISAVTATGSLFATPAIVRGLGFDPLEAMAMTIASTLVMPLALLVNLSLLQDQNFSFDMAEYSYRLIIFIVGPIVLSNVIFLIFGNGFVSKLHGKFSLVSTFLVFFFPFGLIGAFSELVQHSPEKGLSLFITSIGLIAFIYCFGLIVFSRKGKRKAAISAITLGNRNLLLTFAIAGPYLGSEYLPLVGALQLPIFALPWVTSSLLKSRYMSEPLREEVG